MLNVINMAIITYIMAKKSSVLLPSIEHALRELGENMKLARLRRRLPATLVAERAGMSRPTLRAIERGDPGVNIGAYANVLMSLGLEKEIASIARGDSLGRKLQDAQLVVGSRAPKRSKFRGTK